nr:unnamed protein product [Callosobruchus analis]
MCSHLRYSVRPI